MKQYNVEKMKKEIEELKVEDLITIITYEPLLKGSTKIKEYTKEQRKLLKNKLLEIARTTLDLAELERKFQVENIEKRKTIDEEILAILVSLL